MKWYEKELSGLKIIFLHNSFSCHKCIAVMNCEDFDNTVSKYEPQTKLDLKSLCKNFKSKSISQQKKKDVHSKFVFSKPYEHSSKKMDKVLKRKYLRSTNTKNFQALPMNSNKKNNLESVSITQKSVKKRNSVEGNARTSPIKKQACTPDKKDKDSKVPGKGTLKRKRWFLNKLNHKNDNYEDDLFEDQKFGHFQNLFEDETDNAEKYEELKTPVFPFSISPRESTPSPTYRDCYSPTELSRFRKGAEEYQYRRRRRKRKLFFPNDKTEAPQVDPQSREADVQKRLEEVARILDLQRARLSDSEDDQYFSDVLDNSSKVNP